MPVLGHVLRGICVRAVQRLLEDISAAVAKVEAGQAWEDIIKPAPAACALPLVQAGLMTHPAIVKSIGKCCAEILSVHMPQLLSGCPVNQQACSEMAFLSVVRLVTHHAF